MKKPQTDKKKQLKDKMSLGKASVDAASEMKGFMAQGLRRHLDSQKSKSPPPAWKEEPPLE